MSEGSRWKSPKLAEMEARQEEIEKGWETHNFVGELMPNLKKFQHYENFEGMKDAATTFLKSEGKEDLVEGVNVCIDQTLKYSQDVLEEDLHKAEDRHYMKLESDGPYEAEDDPELEFFEDDLRDRLLAFLKTKI